MGYSHMGERPDSARVYRDDLKGGTVDAKTMKDAFGVEVDDEEAELEEPEAEEADESDFDADISTALDPSAPPEDRREAFIRAVKAAQR